MRGGWMDGWMDNRLPLKKEEEKNIPDVVPYRTSTATVAGCLGCAASFSWLICTDWLYCLIVRMCVVKTPWTPWTPWSSIRLPICRRYCKHFKRRWAYETPGTATPSRDHLAHIPGIAPPFAIPSHLRPDLSRPVGPAWVILYFSYMECTVCCFNIT